MGEKQFASTFIPPALMSPCLAVLDFWGEMNFAEKETLGDAVWGGGDDGVGVPSWHDPMCALHLCSLAVRGC